MKDFNSIYNDISFAHDRPLRSIRLSSLGIPRKGLATHQKMIALKFIISLEDAKDVEPIKTITWYG